MIGFLGQPTRVLGGYVETSLGGHGFGAFGGQQWGILTMYISMQSVATSVPKLEVPPINIHR